MMRNLIITEHMVLDADTGDVFARYTYFRTARCWWGQLRQWNDYRRLPSRMLKREWRELQATLRESQK